MLPAATTAAVPRGTVVKRFAALAALRGQGMVQHGATPAQVALAWLLDVSPALLPTPGTSSVRHLAENVSAAGIALTSADRAEPAGGVT